VSRGWVDSHCHLQEHYLPSDEASAAVGALERAAAALVAAVVCVGTDEATSRQAIALAAAVADGSLGAGLPVVRAAVGLHPHEAADELGWLDELTRSPSDLLVALGECGLDYHYEHAPRAAQRQSFAHQIALAQERDLTLVIHARDAWEDLFSVLGSEGVPPRCVLHCFTGGPSEAARCVELGMAVSFSGIVTFKNADELRAAVREVPLSRLLVETDSPWLAPVPFRGKQNEPAWVGLVGDAVSEAGGWEAEKVARATSANASALFGLDLDA
jgi:TatD DNase family protein